MIVLRVLDHDVGGLGERQHPHHEVRVLLALDAAPERVLDVFGGDRRAVGERRLGSSLNVSFVRSLEASMLRAIIGAVVFAVGDQDAASARGSKSINWS